MALKFRRYEDTVFLPLSIKYKMPLIDCHENPILLLCELFRINTDISRHGEAQTPGSAGRPRLSILSNCAFRWGIMSCLLHVTTSDASRINNFIFPLYYAIKGMTS